MNFNRKQIKDEKIRFENNLNAPRMKNAKYTSHLVTRELYDKWYENTEYKEINTYEKFLKYWDNIVEEAKTETTINPLGVRLGQDVGSLRLNYVKKYTPPISEEESNRAGTDLPALNWNTNGKLGKVVWTMQQVKYKNKRAKLYAFLPEREYSRDKAAKCFRETPEIYKDNKISSFQKKVIKDANNPWLHGMEILNKKKVEPINDRKRSYFEREEGTEGD